MPSTKSVRSRGVTKKATEQRAALIDELGALDIEIAAAKLRHENAQKPRVLRQKAIHAELAAIYPDLKGDESKLFEGNEYAAMLFAREYERKIINLPGIFATVGKEKFLEACSLTLKNLDALLPATLRSLYTDIARTGPREFKTFPKPKIEVK